ncbi:hypothetical protein FB446DRAFT_703853 [Lentinula raphanica]|nr:hypothetical protein FB446DRAFT_703853 [Lentinula raphanica]
MYLFTRFAIRDCVLFLGVTCVAFTTALPLSSNYTLTPSSESQHLAARDAFAVDHCLLRYNVDPKGNTKDYVRIDRGKAKQQVEAYMERMGPFLKDNLRFSPEIDGFHGESFDPYYELSTRMASLEMCILKGTSPVEHHSGTTTDSQCYRALLRYKVPSVKPFKPTTARLIWDQELVTLDDNKITGPGERTVTLSEAKSYPELDA